MSVSMIENWSDILGMVQAVAVYDDLDGFDSVEVLVEQVMPVEGYPNLVATYLDEAEQPVLYVLMPVQVVLEYAITSGVVLECRVRRAGADRLFVHTDTITVHRPT